MARQLFEFETYDVDRDPGLEEGVAGASGAVGVGKPVAPVAPTLIGPSFTSDPLATVTTEATVATPQAATVDRRARMRQRARQTPASSGIKI